VQQHLARSLVDSIAREGMFRLDASVELVAHVGMEVEPERVPETAMSERERARYDRLGANRFALFSIPSPELRADDTGEVRLDAYDVHDGEPGAGR
jgi:hypothetical protein